MTYAAKVRKEQDPDKITVASGGEILVESGGVITIETGGKLTVNGVELDAGELGVLNVVAGTVTASKAVVVDGSKDVGDFRNVDVVNLDAGKSGTAGTIDIFPSTASKGKLIISCADQTGDTAVTINTNAMGQATQVNVGDPGGASSYVVQATTNLVGLTVSASEVNSLDASVVGAIKKYAKAALTIVADTNSHDTAIVLPAKAIITNAFIDVTTQEATGATKTVDIGISGGDEDGLLDGIDVSATGVKIGTLASGAQTLGALLSVDEDGAGALVPQQYVGSGATIAYTLGSADFAELVANVVVEYIEVA